MPTTTAFIRPCAPILRRLPPTGPEWIHEVKWDGWRLQAHKWFGAVRLYTRTERDVAEEFPLVIQAVRALKARSLILDGELIATDAAGKPDFHALRRRRPVVLYVVFDILHLDGVDLRREPWTVRRRHLTRLLARGPTGLQLSEIWDDGAALLLACAEQGLEGIVSKHRNAPYRSGNSDAWIKTKVPGWTERNRRRFK